MWLRPLNGPQLRGGSDHVGSVGVRMEHNDDKRAITPNDTPQQSHVPHDEHQRTRYSACDSPVASEANNVDNGEAQRRKGRRQQTQ